ncbi:MAG: FAD-dependent oxidoreductase [Acidobacteria bacterium]|nr:FAD-dependent oxidoreductase [Acidobacteriota bacterium]
MPAKDVIIIGGGLGGLSAAVALAQVGFQVTLFEKRPRLGGRASSYMLPSGEYVDNCQHVTLGCCTNLADFYRRIGAADKIRCYSHLLFLDAHGRRQRIQPSPLAPPLHFALAFMKFPSLSWDEKRAIARLMLSICRNGGRPTNANDMTMLDWLCQQRQPKRAIERFWRVVLVSALNEELDRASASYGIDVFWKAFLANRRGFELGIPAVRLADLYLGCRDVIERHGGEVHTSLSVGEIVESQENVVAARLDDGTTVTSKFFIAAVPPDRLLRILPRTVVEHDVQFANVCKLRPSPITGIHLWFDRQVMADPFAATLGQTVQWIFNKSSLYAPLLQNASLGFGSVNTVSVSGSNAATEGQYLQLVISASHNLASQSREEIVDSCRKELRYLLPATREARLLKSTVIKEPAATFSPEPGCDRWRPTQQSSLKNLFLAGDWTQTGWPATMEGAVRSGYLAAEAILSAVGRPQKLLQPDLPVEGFARWFSRRGVVKNTPAAPSLRTDA